MRQVIDASVVLAYLLDEVGGDALLQEDARFCLSSVNLTEVLTKIVDHQLSIDDVTRVLKQRPIEHVECGVEDARLAAGLRPATRHLGLSLGDRLCLALGQRLALPVLTAERKWAELDIGIDIRLIR